MVDEELLAGVLTDEPISLGLVEPFDRAVMPQLRAPPFRLGAVERG